MAERQFHIQCTAEDIGHYVFLPGDPDRVPWIASYLKTAQKVAQSREFTTYTGTLDGTRVSVTSTGIGGPSPRSPWKNWLLWGHIPFCGSAPAAAWHRNWCRGR